MLIDGQVDTHETAATIIDLAVRGALIVQSSDEHDFRITLVDPSKASAPHEKVLLTNLFDGEPPGAERDLSRPGSMASSGAPTSRAPALRARHRVSKMLLRQGIVYSGGDAWTKVGLVEVENVDTVRGRVPNVRIVDPGSHSVGHSAASSRGRRGGRARSVARVRTALD